MNDIVSKNRQIIIGRNHYGRVPMHELAHMLAKQHNEPKCKICGSTENLMLDGYCIDCSEELEQQAK